MILEFLTHLLSLDINWIVTFLLGNLLAIFLLFAVIFIFLEGKKPVYAFLVLAFLIMVWQDFEHYTGAVVFAGSLLAIYYITKLVVLTFAETTPWLKDKLIILEELQFLTVFIIYNFLFIR